MVFSSFRIFLNVDSRPLFSPLILVIRHLIYSSANCISLIGFDQNPVFYTICLNCPHRLSALSSLDVAAATSSLQGRLACFITITGHSRRTQQTTNALTCNVPPLSLFTLCQDRYQVEHYFLAIPIRDLLSLVQLPSATHLPVVLHAITCNIC